MALRISQVIDWMQLMHDIGRTGEMISAPGVGKSTMSEAFGAHMSRVTKKPYGVLTFMLATITPFDFGGFMYPAADPDNPTGRRVSDYSMPPVIPRPAYFRSMRGTGFSVYVNGAKVDSFDGVPEQGHVFLDEYGQAEVELKKMAADLRLNHRVRGEALPAGWGVFAASNRTDDRSGVTKALAFDTNRVNVQEIVMSYEDWEPWALNNKIHDVILGIAEFAEDKMFTKKVPVEPRPFSTPRSMEFASDMLHAIEHKKKINWKDPFLRNCLGGFIGHDEAVEVCAFAESRDAFPTFDEIVKDPHNAKVPGVNQLDAVYSVCSMLATKVTSKTDTPVLEYLLRIPAEFRASAIRKMVTVSPSVMGSPAMSKALNDPKLAQLIAVTG